MIVIAFLLTETISPSKIIIVCVGLSVIIVILVIIFLCIFLKRGKKKLPPADIIPDHHHHQHKLDKMVACKDSDRSSNISDLKAEIRSNSCEPDYSEMGGGTESIANRLQANMLGSSRHNIVQGVPLAGPVQIPNDYR